MLSTSNQKKNDTSDVEELDLEQKISLSPFDLFGSWDKGTLSSVFVSLLSGTSLFSSLDGRPIKFTKGHYSSRTIRIDNVSIPFSSEKGYGHDYIYICLPDVIEKHIKTYATKEFKNLVGSKYQGEVGEWWKPAYNIAGVFKVTERNRICTPVSVEQILNHSKMGVRANLLVEFSITHTYLAEEDVINVKIKSGFITSMDVDIKPPTPLGIIPGQPLPQDITSDETMKLLEEFRDVSS